MIVLKRKMPKSPIEKAEIIYEKHHPGRFPGVFELSPLEKAMQGMAGLMPADSITTLSSVNPLPLRLASTSALGLNRTWSVSVDRHNVHVWGEDLLHTYKCDKGEFVIASTKAGEYTLHITAICKEFAEPLEQDYEIMVIDEGD